MPDTNVKIINPKNDAVTVSLDVPPVTGDLLISYHTLNGNHPNTNANYIGIWVSDDGNVPPNTYAAYSKIVEKDDTTFKGWSVSFPLQSKGYVLGYCLTGDPADKAKDAYKKVSATCPIDQTYENSGEKGNSVSLQVDNSGTTYFITYKGLENMDCSLGNWIGIWSSSEVIGNTAPFWFEKIKKAGSEGRIVLPEGTLKRGLKYKVGFFMDGFGEKNPEKYTSLADLFTFQVD